MERQLGLLFVLLTPLMAGVAISGGAEIGGLNYTGWMWLGCLFVGTGLIMMEKTFHRESRTPFPFLMWALFFVFAWLSMLWCQPLGRRNIQDALQITMPLIMGITGAMFIRDEQSLRKLHLAFMWTLVPLTAAIVLVRLTVDGLSLRPQGLTTGLIGCLFLAYFPDRIRLAALGWAASLFACFLTEGRTAVIAMLAMVLFHPQLGMKWRAGSILAAAVVGLFVFHTETVQARFFYSGSGTLMDLFQGNFRGSGRFEAWPLIYKEAATRPVLGHGIGASYAFVPTVWYGMNHVHNEFLRIFFELGLVGLTIFMVALVSQLWQGFKGVRQSTGLIQVTRTAVFLGWCYFIVTAATGNPLPSNVWFMNPLFLLMGAGRGVAAKELTADSRLNQRGLRKWELSHE